MKSDGSNMAPLSIEKAFTLLGLSEDATEEELRRTYRKKSGEHHPDKPDGDNAAQSKINEAYTIALEYLSNKRGIIPLTVEKSLMHVDHALSQQKAFLRAKETTERLRKSKTYNLNRLKYLMWFIGATTGVVALFGKTLLPMLVPEGKDYFDTVRLLFANLTFVLGILGFFLQWGVTSIQNRIDSYAEEISDKKTCASRLSEVLKYTDHPVIDETKIIHSNPQGGPSNAISLPFPIPTLHGSDLYSILLQKSLEYGLLEEIEQKELRPNTIARYKVTFSPMLFKPQDIPKQDPKPMTVREARSMLLAVVVLLLLFGSGTAWLGIVKKSLWALLTGFFSLGFIGLAGEAISSWRNAVRRGLRE